MDQIGQKWTKLDGQKWTGWIEVDRNKMNGLNGLKWTEKN